MWSEAAMRGFFAALPALVFATGAQADEKVTLKPGAGRDVVEHHCHVCHSLDYPRTNAPFLSRQGWETEVNKMIKAYGAEITPDDAKIIVDYLAANYGTGG
jgi:mono/diheme cytochrome c family protein